MTTNHYCSYRFSYRIFLSLRIHHQSFSKEYCHVFFFAFRLCVDGPMMTKMKKEKSNFCFRLRHWKWRTKRKKFKCCQLSHTHYIHHLRHLRNHHHHNHQTKITEISDFDSKLPKKNIPTFFLGLYTFHPFFRIVRINLFIDQSISQTNNNHHSHMIHNIKGAR